MREPRAVPLHAPANYAFPKGADGLLPWPHAEEQLKIADNYWVATVRRDGSPHVTPVWAVWVDDALWVDGIPKTQWIRNLRSKPAISVHLESAQDVVILEGNAEDMDTVEKELSDRIVAAWNAKYGRLHPDPVGQGIIRLVPRRGRGWSNDSLEDGTRWQFDD